jgi:DNA-binding MarR family transcriptional regulator
VKRAFRLDRSTGFLVNRLAWSMKTALERELLAHDVTAHQWATLAVLTERGETGLVELAGTLGVDAGATSRLLSRLEQKGLVEKKRSAADARAVRMAITARGTALFPQLVACAERVLDRYRAPLTKSERAELDRLLAKMLAGAEP